MSRRRNRETGEDVDADLLDHIRHVGVSTVEEYRDWCSQNGFSRQLHKHWKARCRERFHAQRETARKRLEQNRRERRFRTDVLADICRGRVKSDEVASPHLRRLCELLEESPRPGSPRAIDRDALLRLLTHVERCSPRLLTADPAQRALGTFRGNSHIEAIAMMARHASRWQRGVTRWQPRTRNDHRQVSALLRHLFVQYEMPEFFDMVWYLGSSSMADRQRRWFLHVATGHNIRHCDLPIPFTKRMAHEFLRAPSGLTVLQAIRWSQMTSLGASQLQVRAILGTRLAEQFTDDEFWVTFLRWLVAHPNVPMAQIGPLVDYLHHQRFVGERHGPAGVLQPAQPNLTMKGREPIRLIREMEAWHRALANDNRQQTREWQPSEIPGLEWQEGQGENRRLWTIRELLSSRALQAEGRQMKHCVAGYSHVCARRQSGIWTMEVESPGGFRKSLTIEVDLSRRQIIQARGKANRLPDERERRVMQLWAARAGLQIAYYC